MQDNLLDNMISDPHETPFFSFLSSYRNKTHDQTNESTYQISRRINIHLKTMHNLLDGFLHRWKILLTNQKIVLEKLTFDADVNTRIQVGRP